MCYLSLIKLRMICIIHRFIREFDVQKKGDPSNWIFQIEDRHDTTTRWHGMAGMNERGREEGKMRTRAAAEAHLILTVLSSTHSSQIVLIVR